MDEIAIRVQVALREARDVFDCRLTQAQRDHALRAILEILRGIGDD